MVEQSRAVDSVGPLSRVLEGAANKLTEISGKSTISQNEMKALLKTLNQVNEHLDPTLRSAKKLAPDEVKAIERALLAVALFQKVDHRKVEPAITSIFSSLLSTLGSLDKGLKNLKKHRIGQRVEKISDSKGSRSS